MVSCVCFRFNNFQWFLDAERCHAGLCVAVVDLAAVAVRDCVDIVPVLVTLLILVAVVLLFFSHASWKWFCTHGILCLCCSFNVTE